jgi:hypothetical protein
MTTRRSEHRAVGMADERSLAENSRYPTAQCRDAEGCYCAMGTLRWGYKNAHNHLCRKKYRVPDPATEYAGYKNW